MRFSKHAQLISPHLVKKRDRLCHTIAIHLPYECHTIKSMEEGRLKKTFRLTPEVANQLEEIAKKLNIAETEALARAITHYYLTLKGEEEGMVKGGLVPLSEYKSAQDKIAQLLYRVGELEGMLKERDRLVEEKDTRIRELKERVERLEKPWWKRIF